jgi:hypothetical protein
MMPKIIGNAAPWKQVSDARTSELNDMQESFYETAIIWARVTGEKTLDDSIHATPKSQLQAQMRWKEAYQSYISPLASASRTEVIHHSVVSGNKVCSDHICSYAHLTSSRPSLPLPSHCWPISACLMLIFTDRTSRCFYARHRPLLRCSCSRRR